MDQVNIERQDLEIANACINELADVFMPIFKRYHGRHIMMALAHIAASNTAAQKDPEAALESHVAMLRERTAHCVRRYMEKKGEGGG